MVFRDLEIPVLRSTSIAHQPRPCEEQDGDVEQKHAGHPDQYRDVRHVAQYADQTQCECQDDDERGDLRKRLVLEQMITAADDASSQLPRIVEGSFPVEKNLLIGVQSPDPGGALLRIGVDFSDLRAINLTNHNSHGFRWYESGLTRTI